MTLWLSVHFLLAAVLLCGAAPTPEECERLLTAESMGDRSTMLGKTYFVAGYVDHKMFKDILKVIEGSWVETSVSVSRTNEVVIRSSDKINGTCLISTMRALITGDTAVAKFSNMISSFQRLPSCVGCLLLNVSSIVRNPKELHDLLKLGSSGPMEEFSFHALYLMAPDPNVTDAVLEQFKKTASCMGFSEELDYQHKPENSFCAEDEGIRVMPVDRSQCDIMKDQILAHDLHKVAGDWVLVHSVSDGHNAEEWEKHLNTSYVELRLAPDNMSLTIEERNRFSNGSCSTYSITMEVLQHNNQTKQPLMRSTVVKVEGVGPDVNETYNLEVFMICPDCLQLLYTEYLTGTRYLLDYKKEGLHSKVHLKADGDSLYKMNAECLGFSHKKVFMFDGVTGFCPKKSSQVDEPNDSWS